MEASWEIRLVSMTDFAASATSRFAPLPSVATAGKDFLYLVLGLPLGIATFTLAVTALSLALGLAITLIGIPLFILTLLATRGSRGETVLVRRW